MSVLTLLTLLSAVRLRGFDWYSGLVWEGFLKETVAADSPSYPEYKKQNKLRGP
jgi:hypothetical protein